MALFTHKELTTLLAHKIMTAPDIYAVISFCSNNAINIGNIDNIEATTLHNLITIYLSSCNDSQLETICKALHVSAVKDNTTESYNVTVSFGTTATGTIIKDKTVQFGNDDLEMSYIKLDDTGLIFAIDTSYIVQEAGAIMNPYSENEIVLISNLFN